MAQEQEEYTTGKRHLANMMGKDPQTFTQMDVDVRSLFLIWFRYFFILQKEII